MLGPRCPSRSAAPAEDKPAWTSDASSLAASEAEIACQAGEGSSFNSGTVAAAISRQARMRRRRPTESRVASDQSPVALDSSAVARGASMITTDDSFVVPSAQTVSPTRMRAVVRTGSGHHRRLILAELPSDLERPPAMASVIALWCGWPWRQWRNCSGNLTTPSRLYGDMSVSRVSAIGPRRGRAAWSAQ